MRSSRSTDRIPPEFSVARNVFDKLIEFGNPFAAGYHKPALWPYSKGDWERNVESTRPIIDYEKGELGRNVRPWELGPSDRGELRGGAVMYPNVGASAAIMKAAPHLRRAYGTPERMSKSIRGHEISHSLLNPDNYRGKTNIYMPAESKIKRGLKEVAILKREFIGRKAKLRLKTPLIHRAHAAIQGFHFSAARNLFNKVIEFKTLHIPKKEDEPPETLPELKGTVDYTVQRHAAKRAGLHRDIRIGTRRRGLLSWATRKDLPAEGGKIAIHPQPVHPHSYLGWEGDIQEGYGAGKVSTEHLGKALITKSSPTEVHATLADQRQTHRVALLKTPHGWLMTRGKHPEPPPEARKPKYKTVRPEKAHEHLGEIEPGTIVQPKIDGALVYVTTKGNRPEVFSHRRSKVSGKHIVHTERFFKGRPTTDIPREHQRTLIGELYGVRKGRAVPPQELGGILNTHLGESINKQKQKGIKLRIMPFDYADGKDESYPDRLAKVKETVRHLPKDQFHTPEEAHTPSAARRLFDKIKSLRHPFTSEGVIVHPPKGRMVKIKNVEEANVKITGTFPGTGKFEGSHGGFTYEGGKVGTGFSDETRRELHKYVGRIARIRHQGHYKSGAYRAPSFIAVEENK